MRNAPLEWLSPEQLDFYESVRRFAATLAGDVLGRDRAQAFDRESWDRCARFGIHGLPVPEDHGGQGADMVTTMLALEALGYGCEDSGLVFSINAHMWASVIPVWLHGTEEQRRHWLPGLCGGSIVGCHAITEPEAGSDAFAIRSTARKVAGGYVLNGRKAFVTNAPLADLVIVFARSAEGLGSFGITAFLVPVGAPGLTVGKPLEKMGLRTSPMSEVLLDDLFAPGGAVLGTPGRGGDVFQTSMRWERPCIMASQVGTMRRTTERCIAYARERRQFGRPIAKYQSVANKIAEMKIALDASRALVLRVGWLADHGLDTTTEAAVAKVFVSEASVRTHLDAVQIHGGYGYMTEFEVERVLRDALGGTIHSGTSEIQRNIIARGLGL